MVQQPTNFYIDPVEYRSNEDYLLINENSDGWKNKWAFLHSGAWTLREVHWLVNWSKINNNGATELRRSQLAFFFSLCFGRCLPHKDDGPLKQLISTNVWNAGTLPVSPIAADNVVTVNQCSISHRLIFRYSISSASPPNWMQSKTIILNIINIDLNHLIQRTLNFSSNLIFRADFLILFCCWCSEDILDGSVLSRAIEIFSMIEALIMMVIR